LLQNTSGFSKIVLCPNGKGEEVEAVRTFFGQRVGWLVYQFLVIFMPTSFMNGLQWIFAKEYLFRKFRSANFTTQRIKMLNSSDCVIFRIAENRNHR